MAWACFPAPQPLRLAPRSVNSDRVTAEVTHCACVSQGPLHRGRTPVRAHLESSGVPAAHGCVRWLSHDGKDESEPAAAAAVQPGEKKRLRSSYGSWVFLQPLSLRLASPGFRDHCTRHSKTTGVMDRIRHTRLFPVLPFFKQFIQFCDPEPVGTLTAFLTFSLLIQQVLATLTLAFTHCVLCPLPLLVQTTPLSSRLLH